jgi:hypothetical protein
LTGRFLGAQLVTLLVGSLIAAGVVYLIVNDGGEGPTFGRVLLALVLGNALRLLVLVIRIRTVQHLHGWQANPSAPLLFALSEPLLAPFSFLGLLLSAAVLANAQRNSRTGATRRTSTSNRRCSPDYSYGTTSSKRVADGSS